MPDYDAIIKAVENDKPLPKNVIDIPDVKESHTSYINRMQELNERIAQLTELVNTGTKTLESLEETLKTVEKERDRLADQREERKPKFERVRLKEKYYFIDKRNRDFVVICDTEEGHPLDKAAYDDNNYFHTELRAQEVVDKINFLLKLERLHDTFCPDYVPNWDDWRAEKWEIDYENSQGRYKTLRTLSTENKTAAYFPTEEIAQKVCDILNKELEEKK